jgi:glycosyltransferase involved in cell wall biosynthesis
MYFKVVPCLFACCSFATMFGSCANTGSNSSRVEDVVAADGRRIVLEDLILQDCVEDQISCIWTDSFGTPVFIENSIKGWIHKPEDWRYRSTHGPYEIADAINYAMELVDSNVTYLDQSPESGPNWRSEFDAPLRAIVDTADQGIRSLSMPIFILSDPEKPDKRENAKRLLRSIGISGNISFLPFTKASTIDIGHLITTEVIDEPALNRMEMSGWIGEGALASYIANAIDHLEAVKAGADSGFELFGVFGDDLMLAGSPDTIRLRIMHALQMFPPSADVLYLEACHEKCSERKYSYFYPQWARTTGPSCNSAMIFTKKGARRVTLICRYIFWGSDKMYASMIRAGLLEAYVITPHAFLQDGFWKSSLEALSGSGEASGHRAVPGLTHRPNSALCKEFGNELRLVQVQISQETTFLRKCFANTYLASSPSKAMFLSDILSENPGNDHRDLQIAYFAKDFQDSWNQVGSWPQEYGVHGVVLWIDNRSVCYDSIDMGKCVLKVQLSVLADVRVTNIEPAVRYVEVSDLLFVYHRVDEQNDILLTSFRSTKEICSRQQVEPVTEEDSGSQSSQALGSHEIDEFLHQATQKFLLNEMSLPSNEEASADVCGIQKNSLLTGVHFIFDGIMYKWYSGKMSGVNKMWYNIVPFMADIVHSLNGTFTHCQSSWLSGGGDEKFKDIPRVTNYLGCENLTQEVQDLPGDKKIVFSSYYRIAELEADDRVCNILPLYDFIPERMDVYDEQHTAFYLKAEHIPLVSGFLSLSNSTTSDLQDLHGIDSRFVSTSPNRVAKIFKRVKPVPELEVVFENDFVGSDGLQKFLNSARRYLLLIGASKYSPAYKGYDIFWSGLSDMPPEFMATFSLIIIGDLPEHRGNLPDIVCVPDVPEHVLPILYSRASALIYPSKYEGFGMPPIEAIACGCPVILGSFYENKMQYVYGSDALYGGNIEQMKESLLKVYRGEVPSPEKLIARARRYGADPKHGWNEVAKHYLEYMISGPFMETKYSKCEALLSPECKSALQIEATENGLKVI